MHPSKSSGLDGIYAIFFQNYWLIIGSNVNYFVLEFLNSRVILDGLSHTFVPLIPKVKNPVLMKDLRLISHYNVLYKLILKVLTNRLKCVLQSVIHSTLSAFVLGRLISDNTMVAFEIFRAMKRNIKSRKVVMTLKLDMSKAYD